MYIFTNWVACGVCRDGSRMGTAVVVAMRPPFKRSNTSLRRTGSHRFLRRPTSLLAPPDVVPQVVRFNYHYRVKKCMYLKQCLMFFTFFIKKKEIRILNIQIFTSKIYFLQYLDFIHGQRTIDSSSSREFDYNKLINLLRMFP